MDPNAAEIAYWNLVSAARAEQGIAAEEQRVLNAHVLKLGLDPDAARRIQKEAEAENPPRMRIPKDGPGRLATLRAVLEVVAADGSLAPKELAVVRALGDRVSLDESALDRLVKAALRREKGALDRAFAALGDRGAGEGVELVILPAPRPEPRRAGELFRSMPFAARLAPRYRSCRACGLAFANEDRYAQYCRDCRIHEKISELTGGRIETLTGALFVVLVIPAAFIVHATTDLWSWGWSQMGSRPGYGYRRSHRGDWIYLVPAVLASAIPAWLAAWAITRLVVSLGRRRSS